MLVDMRSDEQAELDKLHQEILECIRQGTEQENQRWESERTWNRNLFGRTYDPSARITVEFEKVGDRPCGNQSQESPIVQTVVEAYQALGVDPPAVAHSSTDANIPLSLHIPAVTISGGGRSGNCHSLNEWFDTTDSFKGTQRILLAVLGCTGLRGISTPLLPKRLGKLTVCFSPLSIPSFSFAKKEGLACKPGLPFLHTGFSPGTFPL